MGHARSSCCHLLGGVLRLRAMGLSDSVLSCLLFIAGLLYLLDPLYVCMHIHTCLHLHVCFRKCVTKACVALSRFIIAITVFLSTRHADIGSSSRGNWVDKDKSRLRPVLKNDRAAANVWQKPASSTRWPGLLSMFMEVAATGYEVSTCGLTAATQPDQTLWNQTSSQKKWNIQS